MIHPETEVRYIDAEKGYGLFALSSIPRGSITWTKDPLDREFSPQDLLSYPSQVQDVILHYSYRNNKGNFVFCWDNTRYINHDCSPNSCITPYQLELAVRDIQPGEEITNHYGTLNIIEPFTLDGPNGVTIYPDDLLRHSKDWDLIIAQAMPFLGTVDQPLRRFISNERWQILEETSSGKRQLESIINCYFKG